MEFVNFILVLAFIGVGYVGSFGNLASLLFRTLFDYDSAREPKRWAAGMILYWVLATILTVYFCSWALEDGIVAISIGIIILGIICCIYFLGDAPVGQCPKCGEWFSYVQGKRTRGGHYYADDVVERDIKNRNGDVIGSYETTEKRMHYWSKHEYTCKKCGNTIEI
jgi:predicted RNA-binding Zn-ribbon protein involved in translation (DUF1610 family)